MMRVNYRGRSSDATEDDVDWFEPFSLWYRFPRWCRPISARQWRSFPGCAHSSRRCGCVPDHPAPVSPRLLEACPRSRRSSPSSIPARQGPHRGRTPPNGLPIVDREPWVALFFSMGSDSFYSLLKNQREHPADSATITHLISLHGFDAAHHGWDETFPPALLRNFTRVSDDLGKTLVPVVTNVRQVGARHAVDDDAWGRAGKRCPGARERDPSPDGCLVGDLRHDLSVGNTPRCSTRSGRQRRSPSSTMDARRAPSKSCTTSSGRTSSCRRYASAPVTVRSTTVAAATSACAP